MYWLKTGAQPTDTVRALLSREGVLLKWHLEKKNIPAERATEIFNTWKAARDTKVENTMNEKQRAQEAKRKAIDEKRAADLKAKDDAARAEADAAAAAAAPAPEAPVSEEPVAEATETPAEATA
jgi:small subunit ribosomal protein S16